MTTPNGKTDIQYLKDVALNDWKGRAFFTTDQIAGQEMLNAAKEIEQLRTRLAELEAVVNGPVKILYAADYAGWTYEFVLKNPHPLYLTREACEASHRPLPDTENSPTSAPTDRGTGPGRKP